MKHKNIHNSKVLEQYRSDVSRCVKCGACRAVCPSFLRDRGESFSARGRMALVQAVLDKELAVSTIFKDRLATCTGCLACEASCPSGVPITKIIQAAKEQALAESGAGLLTAAISGLLQHPGLLRAAAWLAPAALRYTSGRGSWGRGHGESVRSGVPGTRSGKKGRVVFFPGCAIEHFQPEVGEATAAVLNALGYDVLVPDGLKCCGRPLLSLGDRAAASELAEHNHALLAAFDAEAVVTSCASCGLTFKKEYPKLLRPGANAPAVQDIHEFLATRISTLELGPVNQQVTWHDPCHLGRGQELSGTAREILRSVAGLDLVEMNDPDRCCGFGGVMRITHHGLSDGIAGVKAANIIETGASAVVTGCPGCRMQLADALWRAGSDIEALHTVQVLARARGDEGRRTHGDGCAEKYDQDKITVPSMGTNS